ncbi:dermonecrotic toxin domain-containing protein [Pseudomonas sp. B33.4]|uniref:dermonecrotic toxin domain-containing protein n=1 Tax=Pseudomonas sp. B33.4 TaxID=3104265 RepID=UPI002ADED481|nr:DUF6543 domain-containing protein [Pseudomonas sp. B33.4]
MHDSLTLDLPAAPAPSLAAAIRLPKNIDESLLQQAGNRWRDSSEGLRELFAASPGLRDTLNEVLQQQLKLDGETVGLRFAATDERAEHFVSLTDACAFVVQHPTLETSLDQRSQVTGLAVNHPLYTLKPLQLLEKLKRLEPEQAHATRWAAFWDARAPRTPMARRELATQLYREHFEAAANVAFARKILSTEQLKALQHIIDARSGALTLNDQPIHTEKLALVLSNHSKVKLTGAWVISVGDPATASPLLYLPSRSVCIQPFDSRQAMQDWLTAQGLVPTGLSSKALRFEYSADTLPMVTGSSDLFAVRQQAQISALRNANRGKPGLMAHGAQSLVQADLIDRQRGNTRIVAAAPDPAAAPSEIEMDQKPVFGSLSAGVPLAVRHAVLKREREALAQLLENDRDGTRQKDCEDALDALEAAEQACDKAATILLEQELTCDLVATDKAFIAMHQAHKDGLYAEAKLQRTLGHLPDDEHDLLKALLDTPVAADRDSDFTVASLTLSMTETVNAITTAHTETLKGPFVITRQNALSDRDSIHSLMLYWPGDGGGLQRFANRKALEREVFMIQEEDTELTLSLSSIATDPVHHSLHELICDFAAKAATLRDKTEHADALDILRTKNLAMVQVPVHAARSLSFAHLLEQDRSGKLASHLPDWLIKLKGTERKRLRENIGAYISAMRKSHKLMTLALEPRDDFTRKQLYARLSKDFSTGGHFAVQVSLPDSTSTEPFYESGPAGNRKTTVIVPSAKRSTMSLEDLAQLNIDNVQSVLNDALSQRLVFMRAEVTATQTKDRYRLQNGINLTYLRKVLPELDLPKAYEQKIRDAFIGTASEPVFVKEHRRESLIEPWRLMLKIQGDIARLQKHLNDDDVEVLNIAIDATTAEAWLSKGKRVVLLPVSLTVGGKDTPQEGPVTLSGVTFIEEQVSGVTLLYLPDSPDEQFFRQYDNLEAARKGLYTLCGNDKWIAYVAGKTLQGNVRAHVSRINQAVEKNFDAMIGVGVRWPASTSLATHLLDAHMGRLIEAHRGTSRSNDELFFERQALKGPRAFNYIKMALGMVPFVGTAVALYDAWAAANQAVTAFLRGDVGDGLAAIESMLLSLIDALMDFLPGEAVASTLAKTTRALTVARQLHRLVANVAALHGKSQRQVRHVLARFVDYEYERPLSLTGLEPATHGLYRGVYRHADGDFIERQGRLFQVELSKDSRSWRLSGNSRKTYKQPIALDETGEWDTWFGVYGTTLEGGLLGGGNITGRLADALDPYWPPAVRQRLPHWWTDRNLRRQLQLTAEADDLADQMQARGPVSEVAINAYGSAVPTGADVSALHAAAEAACLGDIQMATRHYQKLSELLPLTHGNKKRTLLEIQSKNAWLLTDRYWRRAYHVSYRIQTLTKKIDELNLALDVLPLDRLTERLRVLEEVRTLRADVVKKLDQIEALRDQLNQWYERIRSKTDRQKITVSVMDINSKHSDTKLLFQRTSHQLEIIKRYGQTDDASWFFLIDQSAELRIEVDQALHTHYHLPNITATPDQRSLILKRCVELYDRFRLEMTIWTANYPQHFHMATVNPLLDGIEQIADRARKGIVDPPSPRTAGQPVQRVFTTDDNQLLYGVEQWDAATQTRRYKITGRGGHEQIWEQSADGKFRLTNPRAAAPPESPQINLPSLLHDAQRRLDTLTAYRATVEKNADLGMLPVDLQHMMDSQATELNRRATLIESRAAQHPLIQQLRNKANALTIDGRAIRTQRSLTSQKPTDGMLDDLIVQGAVEIRRTNPIKLLGKHQGRNDYMQEYEIWNITLEPARLLWYAHFHYRSATAVFRRFETGHLKLPAHRFLTHADIPELPYSGMTHQSVVLRHFEALPSTR